MLTEHIQNAHKCSMEQNVQNKNFDEYKELNIPGFPTLGEHT